MEYKPRWKRILFLAAVFNFVAILVFASNFFSFTSKIKETPKDLIEVTWADIPAENVELSTPETVPIFSEIKLPPIEIPKIEIPAISEPAVIEKPVEMPQETAPPIKDSPSQLKAVVKVYPKDLLEQLLASGAIPERVTINGGEIVLAITVGVDGKVKDAEILRGEENSNHGTMINLVSKIAASSWIFEPYSDETGNPKEIKTQIEFKPEDF
ncbi:MAG: hypothetical protein IJQ16_08490 [Selenomonadaceae bacterium]|nr:hypothetical protein [Selenomonadaceae bacterium]